MTGFGWWSRGGLGGGVAKPPLHHSTMEYYGRLLVRCLMRAQEFAKEACSMAKEKSSVPCACGASLQPPFP